MLRNSGLIMKFIDVVIRKMEVIFFVICKNCCFVYMNIVGKIIDMEKLVSNVKVYILIIILCNDVSRKLSSDISIIVL